MARSQKDDQYSAAEAKRRMEAALRGARITGHKTMKDIPPKRAASRKVRKKPGR